jgi:hypothetical protein
MRERMSASVKIEMVGKKINIELTHSLDQSMYDLP